MSYQSEVNADFPYVYYSDASAAPWADDIGTLDMTVSGATPGAVGPLTSGDSGAFDFDGTDDFGQVALDLSGTDVVTVECWLWWDAFASGFDMAYEFRTQWDQAGGFVLSPDCNDATVQIAHWGDVGANDKRYARPSAAAWHYIAVVYDYSQVAADEVTAYLDGALWTPSSQPSANNNTGSHVSSTLNVMCRNGAQFFGAGDMAHLAVYKSSLSPARIAAHFDAAAVDAGPQQTAIWPYNRQGPF